MLLPSLEPDRPRQTCLVRQFSSQLARLSSFVCLLQCSGVHQHLHSFPTRRSSDLTKMLSPIDKHKRLSVLLGVPVLLAILVLLAGSAPPRVEDRKSTRLNSSH